MTSSLMEVYRVKKCEGKRKKKVVSVDILPFFILKKKVFYVEIQNTHWWWKSSKDNSEPDMTEWIIFTW